ncbi:hypothetical protein [Microbulbifer sp. PAAF003]|uniref:hypothetical protein n=1 Tax=Microbulbifer sp. PAAF003 TaxID=3243375 RepID=UPI00403A0C58
MKNYRTYFLVAAALSFLAGCSHTYTPSVYNIEESRIPELDVKGNVNLVNSQNDTKEKYVKASGHKWEYTNKDITDGFNTLLQKEISLRDPNKEDGNNKKLISKVNKINCTVGFGSYVRKCSISVEIETGDGSLVKIEGSQGSPIFNTMEGSLDGTIAIAVIEALKHPDIVSYLGK